MKFGRDFLVYLAGPISGLTYDDGQTWREYVAANLPKEIRAISPLRAKSQRLARVGIINDSYEDNPLTSQNGITTRDRMDCCRSNLVFANFLGAQKCSAGTPIEFGWADLLRIPIIMIMEKQGNPYDHPMMRSIAGWRVETVDGGIALCEAILMPEGKGTPREIVPGSRLETYQSMEPIANWNVPVLDPGLKAA
jgi:hypothetical protein